MSAAPAIFQPPKLPANVEPAKIVTRHPAGGWTHAVKVTTRSASTARVYVGHFPTAKQAARAL